MVAINIQIAKIQGKIQKAAMIMRQEVKIIKEKLAEEEVITIMGRDHWKLFRNNMMRGYLTIIILISKFEKQLL